MKNTIKPYITISVLVLLIVAPVFLLLTQGSARALFSSSALLSTFGKIFGLLGLACFGFGLLLGSRFRWLDNIFYGLPRAIQTHRWVGTMSFVFIVLHPLLLAAGYLKFSADLAFGIFLMWTDVEYILAYLALIFFMALILMTFFWRMRYERLKSLHSLMAIPLMLGGLHALLIESDVSRSPALAIYFIILISTSVFAYLLRLFRNKPGLTSKKYQVRGVEMPNQNSVKVTLSPLSKNNQPKAGQFIFVRFVDMPISEEHPFSITSIAEDGTISIIAKSLGDYTDLMKNLKAGGIAYVDGPFGSFGDAAEAYEKQIWIAGGIGITPFASLAQKYSQTVPGKSHIHLFYAVTSPSDFVELDKFEKLATQNQNFALTTNVSSQQGILKLDNVRSKITDINNHAWLLCGPPAMIKCFLEDLQKAGVPKKQIFTEAFQML